MAVRAVLWDADGVLQRLPGFDELWGFLPEEIRLRLLAEVFADMPDVLMGRVDMAARVDRVLAVHCLACRDRLASARELRDPSVPGLLPHRVVQPEQVLVAGRTGQ